MEKRERRSGPMSCHAGPFLPCVGRALSTSRLLVVKPPQELLGVLEFALRLLDGRSQALQADFVVRLRVVTRLVFPLAIVLDFFAAVLHLRQAECRGRALKEVAERGE